MKKKNKTGLIIGIVVALILVAGVAVILVGKVLGNRPDLRIKRGAANMAAELAQYGGSLSEEIDFTAINKLKDTGAMHINTDVSITIPEGEVDNLSFSIDALTDLSKKRAEYDIGVGVYGFDVTIAELTASDDTLYLDFPMLLEDTYSLGLTSLGEEFNNSEWALLLDTELPEDYSIELFRTDSEEDTSEGLFDILCKSSAVLKENVVYENIKEKKDDHTGVRMTIDKDAVNLYMESLQNDIFESDFYAEYVEELTDEIDSISSGGESGEMKETTDELIEEITSLRLKTDYVLDFYFDKKGRIVNICTPADMELENGNTVAVDISFLGGERTLDIIDGGIYVKCDEKISYLGIEREADVSASLYNEKLKLLLQTDSHDEDMAFSYTNDYDKENMSFEMELEAEVPDNTIRFAADGEFTDIVKGESYTFRLNNASLDLDGDEICYGSLVAEVEPSDKEIDLPETSVDLLEMNMNEIQAMIYEAIGSIRKFDYE